MSDDEHAVRAANEAFYAAFARNDLAAMDEHWAHDTPLCCIHPGREALCDREAIMASWAAIFSGGASAIRCERVMVRVTGDAATVVCEEVLGPVRLTATNGLVRSAEGWKMWHHHAAPLARRIAPVGTQLPN